MDKKRKKPGLVRRVFSGYFGISNAVRLTRNGGQVVARLADASFGSRQSGDDDSPWPDFESYVAAYEACYHPRAGWLARRRRQCLARALICYVGAGICLAMPILTELNTLGGLSWLRGNGGAVFSLLFSCFAFFTLLLTSGLIAAWRARQIRLKRLIPFKDFLTDICGWLG